MRVCEDDTCDFSSTNCVWLTEPRKIIPQLRPQCAEI
jgi:hypothetical protein